MTDEPLRIRAPVVRIVDHGASTTVIGPHGARRFDGDSAALLRAVLEIHARPVRRSELFAALAARAGIEPAPLVADARGDGAAPTAIAPIPSGVGTERPAPLAAGVRDGASPIALLPTQPVDELVALLVADGVLVAAREPPAPRAPWRLRRVVLGISGAIAAVDAPALIRGLQGSGCDVRVALTRSAVRLVSRAALDALTHHAVWSGLWQRDARVPVPHIQLAEWAELVVVCPASATTLSRIATGDCADLVAAIVTATRAPVVIVPSMNDAMYASPAVQANLATLRDHGRHVVHPALGVEVAHPPHARPALLGPAPPAGAIVDIVRHLLAELAARPRVPDSPRAWEQLWSTTPAEQLPWHVTQLEPALAEAIDARHTPGARLLDLGTGDGAVAITAARRGFVVTAVDIAPSALGQARERADRAGARTITFVLDDITAARLDGAHDPRLDGAHDLAIDRGLLHALPRERWPAYAAGVARLLAPTGALIIVAHDAADQGTTPVTAADQGTTPVTAADQGTTPVTAADQGTTPVTAADQGTTPVAAADQGTTPVTAADLAALFPAFALVRALPTTLAGAGAQQYELERRPP